MNNFLVGLQFLSRISIKKNLDWSEKSCGGSVKFFPAVGLVLGIIYAISGYFIYDYILFMVPNIIKGFILLALNIYLTGALHCDGFCDTMDGILSGRQGDKILEIMKDSRVGAHGATSLILVLIGKFVMFSSLPIDLAPFILFFMAIVPRLSMSYAVVLFPYARKEGLGKAFHEYSTKKDLAIATLFVLGIILMLNILDYRLSIFIFLASICTIFALYRFNNYVAKLIGGLTGDVYGATTELGELIFLIFSIAFAVLI